MIKIPASGKSFSQGWNDTLASTDEKPGMRSSFTYDYWIDSTEVTQKRFSEITGRKPVADTLPHGVGDAYPVYDVTWFDAALFCNARSRAERIDTVYVYFGIKALPSGIVYELTGLRYDLSRDGYRLPTESEWEFAARGGSSLLPFSKQADTIAADEAAWHVVNASDKTHPVATKRPNQLGLYDMAGNVFEWTNDWKGTYDGKDIVNSLGMALPGGEYEKVIKGGGYNYGFLYLRPSHRSATYATTLSSANEYVGFRCARGGIPNGRYIGISPTSFTPNPVNIVASRDLLRSFLGTGEAKIAFVNVSRPDRTLCCVDYSSTMPFVMEFTDDRDVYKPAISPDGRFVAYCSGNEGQSGPSKISIRSLDSIGSPVIRLDPDTAYIPRWWVDRSNGDTCIVYTNSAMINSNALWKTTKTFIQKISGGKPAGAPQVAISDGGFHDGLSADKRYAVSGYTQLLMRDLVTNAEKQLFCSPGNGKDALGSNQVCNVSISPDTGALARCLFLDFGYPRMSAVTGCSYGVHQYLFISSYADTVSTYFRCPEGEESWDNPAWTNQPRFAVACCRNGADQAHAVYAVDLKDHGYLPLVMGTELEQPCMWIRGIVATTGDLALDSIGMYDEPPISEYQHVFSYKMYLFWKLRDSLAVAFLGSSQTWAGIDCSRIPGLPSINMGYAGCQITGSILIIRNYILNHCPKIRVIGISATPYWLAEPGGDGLDLWKEGIIQNKGYLYDKNHGFWKNGLPPDFISLIERAPHFYCCGWDSSGYGLNSCDGWGGANPDCQGRIDWNENNADYQKNFAAIKSLSEDLAALKIHLIMINFPESPAYKHTDHFARVGPSWPTGKAVMEQFRSLEKGNPYYHFYDAYRNGDHDYTDLEASNWNHLCPAGAKKLTSRLDSLILTFGVVKR